MGETCIYNETRWTDLNFEHTYNTVQSNYSMKYLNLTYFLVYILSISYANAHENAASNLRTVSKFDNDERQLSVWTSFLSK